MWNAIENMPAYLRGVLMGLFIYRILEEAVGDKVLTITGMAMTFLFLRFIAVKFVVWRRQQKQPQPQEQ